MSIASVLMDMSLCALWFLGNGHEDRTEIMNDCFRLIQNDRDFLSDGKEKVSFAFGQRHTRDLLQEVRLLYACRDG